MKRFFILLTIIMPIIAANTVLAGTSFYSAHIRYRAYDASGNPTSLSVSESFTDKTNTTCVTGYATEAADCIRYQLSAVNLEDANGRYWRADFTQVYVGKSGDSGYACRNWDAIRMNADFPATSPRWWGNDFNEIGLETSETDLALYGVMPNYASNRPLWVNNAKSEIRFAYTYSSGGSMFAREFSFQANID